MFFTKLIKTLTSWFFDSYTLEPIDHFPMIFDRGPMNNVFVFLSLALNKNWIKKDQLIIAVLQMRNTNQEEQILYYWSMVFFILVFLIASALKVRFFPTFLPLNDFFYHNTLVWSSFKTILDIYNSLQITPAPYSQGYCANACLFYF